jgi:mono/diheme cytochrome c family protein
MKSVALTSAWLPALLYIIFLPGILPSLNFGVDGRAIGGMEGNFLMEVQTDPDESSAGRQPSPQQGMELFASKGCVACHDADAQTEGKLGPRMKGLFGATRNFEDGKSAVADENYIRQSILAPTEKVVKGYQGVMPPYGSILTPDEVESVILYIKSL